MSDDDTPKIEVRENGFYRVANVDNLIGADGQEMETKPVMALCRCGLSQNKPFCDGSHKRQGFDGAGPVPELKEKILNYEGKDIDIHYSILLCSHAGECGRRLEAVFDSSQRPWIMPDNGSVEDIKAVVRACPSGALRYSEKGGTPQHIAEDSVSITVEKNGPLRVSKIELVEDRWSEASSKDSYVLCRCGLSKNKPFCDGTHKDEGWTDGS